MSGHIESNVAHSVEQTGLLVFTLLATRSNFILQMEHWYVVRATVWPYSCWGIA